MAEISASELLLQSLRIEEPQAKAARLSSLTTQQWEALLAESDRHGLTSLLGCTLPTLETVINLPEQAQQHLRQACLVSTSRNLRLLHELGLVLQALEAAEIPVIALKGAFLAQQVYDSIGMRPMGDADLLVTLDQLSRASEVLTKIGLQPSRPYKLVDEIRSMHHLPPFTISDTLTVELHWTPVSPTSSVQLDPQDLWDHAQSTMIANQRVQALCYEDLLIHLCVHICQHEFRLGLKHLYDLAAVLEHTSASLDWSKLTQRAMRFNAGKCVYLTMLLAQALLNAPIPEQRLATLRPSDFDQYIYTLACERVLTFSRDWQIHPDIASLWRTPSWRARVSALRQALFPHTSTMAAHYHLPPRTRRVYLYYPKRLFELLITYAGQLGRLMRREPAARNLARQETAIREWLDSALTQVARSD